MHLADMRHGIDREQRIDRDVSVCFLTRLAHRAAFRRFMFFEKPRRQSPEVLSWFDRAATQQDVVAGRNDGADNYFRIGIVNVFALRTDVALVRVAFRHTPHKGFSR